MTTPAVSIGRSSARRSANRSTRPCWPNGFGRSSDARSSSPKTDPPATTGGWPPGPPTKRTSREGRPTERTSREVSQAGGQVAGATQPADQPSVRPSTASSSDESRPPGLKDKTRDQRPAPIARPPKSRPQKSTDAGRKQP